jgi:hypothetical protein
MTSLDPAERPDLATVRVVLDRYAVSRSGMRLGRRSDATQSEGGRLWLPRGPGGRPLPER